jgi:hypothetical protein
MQSAELTAVILICPETVTASQFFPEGTEITEIGGVWISPKVEGIRTMADPSLFPEFKATLLIVKENREL